MSDELKQLSDAYKQACDQYPMLDLVCELRTYTEAKDAEISRLTAELAAMRERCERLTNECFWTRSLCDIKDHDRKHAEMIRARVQVDLYNDLTPPKETSDGQ